MENKRSSDKENPLKEFWDVRFGDEEYFYGKEPNVFFKSVIDSLPPGRVLIPGAGEGRDAVYAAIRGWEVYCVDISEHGRDKALKLATENDVVIHYEVADIGSISFPDSRFDLVASIFFHLPGDVRRSFYANAVSWLKPGGLFVMQAFTPKQLMYTSGGPKDPGMLITATQTEGELSGLDISELKETEVFLEEGRHHHGMACVLNLIGKKKIAEG